MLVVELPEGEVTIPETMHVRLAQEQAAVAGFKYVYVYSRGFIENEI